jgi:shikimate dehydrogenase
MLRLGLIGFPLGHSLSPALHQAALEHFGLEGSYELLETPSEALAQRVEELKSYQGFNVTLPHKEKILSFLDEVDPLAREIGAVNTVQIGRRLVGHNTDLPGFLHSLTPLGSLEGPALVLGAGGAARAVVLALRQLGLEVWLSNRTLARAQALASLGARQVLTWDERLVWASRARLIVNTTSLGLEAPWETPLPAEAFPDKGWAVDLVYRPLETRFLREARARGLVVLGGLEMLIWQAALAFELWTGRRPPIGLLREAALRAL